MANGRSSVFRGAGKAAGKYRASQERARGFEAQKVGAAALDELNLEKMYETTGAIGEGIGLASSIVDSAYSKKETGEAMKGMKATEKKQGFGDWLFGAEKEYDITDDKGKSMTLKQSELKTAWGTKKAEFAEKGKLVKQDKPTMLAEAGHEKKKKGIQPSIEEAIAMSKGKKPRKRMVLGKEKGIDTKTKDWFQSLFKGGADKDYTGDNSTALDAKFDPSSLPKELQNIGIVKSESPQDGSKLNPYIGMSFSKAYGTANKATGGQGTFWWESEKGEAKEYGF